MVIVFVQKCKIALLNLHPNTNLYSRLSKWWTQTKTNGVFSLFIQQKWFLTKICKNMLTIFVSSLWHLLLQPLLQPNIFCNHWPVSRIWCLGFLPTPPCRTQPVERLEGYLACTARFKSSHNISIGLSHNISIGLSSGFWLGQSRVQIFF